MGKLSKLRDAVDLASTRVAAAVGLGAATQSQDADAIPIIDPKTGKRIIEAFHGSPHKFDKFDINKIGTGEGAQAYGYGLYFTDSDSVARYYKNTLSEPRMSAADKWDIAAEKFPDDEGKQGAWHLASEMGYSKKEALRIFDEMARGEDSIQWGGRVTRADIENLPDDSLEFGSLYRAHLDVDPDTLLDWDKPLSEQSEAVQNAAAEIIASHAGMPMDHANRANTISTIKAQLDSVTGKDILDRLSGIYHRAGAQNPQAMASQELLVDYGIPGIRYQDGMSRGKDGGTYNYVMFDDANISIQERGMADVGLLGAIAAGTGTAITGVNNALNFAFDAMELPSRGLHGLAAALGVLAEGGDWNAAIERGAEVSGQPIDETAQELGQYVADKTGSAPAAALTDAITRVATLEP